MKDDACGQVDDPVLRQASSRIVIALGTKTIGQGRIGHLNDERDAVSGDGATVGVCVQEKDIRQRHEVAKSDSAFGGDLKIQSCFATVVLSAKISAIFIRVCGAYSAFIR